MSTEIKIAVWDLETNGLLDSVTKIHCLVINDLFTGLISRWTDHDADNTHGTIEEGLNYLSDLNMSKKYVIGGHNTIQYDHAVIEKLFPAKYAFNKVACIDTLVMARLIWSHIKEIDADLMHKGKLPGHLFGRHSLEAWGVRIGIIKGDFGKKQEGVDTWSVFTQEMLDYCEQDVKVTAALLKKCLDKNYSPQAVTLEHDIQWVMAQMQRNGFYFNVDKAAELLVELTQVQLRLEANLMETFAPWDIQLADFIPARDNKSKGYLKGVPVPRFKTIMFNPKSRDHIASRLIALYGWKPEKLTDGGKPQVDEEVMATLDYPEAPLLTEYLMVSKRISQLADGDAAWLKLVTPKGIIHGSINPNGAVTGRATHSRPNISQVPNSAAPYGTRCRELFTVPPGWLLVGADASGLELRCLAHYMARWDDGRYADTILNGDIHTVNQKAAGLETRNQAKTFIYGFLYGAGDEKIGQIVGKSASVGKALKTRFLKGLPALKILRDSVILRAKSGSLRGLDGREIYVRSPHSSLNTLLQSAGALVCKQWVVLVEHELDFRFLKHGWDGDYALCAWSHDEIQIACRSQAVADIVKEVAAAMVTKAGEIFNFRCRLNGDTKQGLTWNDTH